MWIDIPNGLCNTSRVAEFKIEESSGEAAECTPFTPSLAMLPAITTAMSKPSKSFSANLRRAAKLKNSCQAGSHH